MLLLRLALEARDPAAQAVAVFRVCREASGEMDVAAPTSPSVRPDPRGLREMALGKWLGREGVRCTW